MSAVEVVDIGEHNLAAAKMFLEKNPETSLFLLSNIRAYGTRVGPSLYSGNLKGLQQDGELCAVFSLTRGGSLLAQTDGRTEHARRILEVCATEPFKMCCILGEWGISKAIWDLMAGQVRPVFVSKEISYRLDLTGQVRMVAPPSVTVRLLTADDYPQWEELALAFQHERSLPDQGTRDQHKAAFMRSIGQRHWWGAIRHRRLLSFAAIIALHETMGQVGSVFTVPEHRNEGLGRAVMTALLRDSRLDGLDRLFLFTGEDNGPARRLYESLGFNTFGHFGLFFGE